MLEYGDSTLDLREGFAGQYDAEDGYRDRADDRDMADEPILAEMPFQKRDEDFANRMARNISTKASPRLKTVMSDSPRAILFSEKASSRTTIAS